MKLRVGAAATILATSTVVSAQPVFHSTVDLVHFGLTVVDKKGTLVSDLRPGDFQVVEEGRPQQIELFVKGEEATVPLHLGLLFDTSGSMGDDIAFSRSAAIKFLKTLSRAEDVTLVDFDTEVRVTKYQQTAFPQLVERIRNRKPDGYTALYDALGVYLDGSGTDSGQKILVIYTDGGDTGSAMTFGDAMDLVRASDVAIYAIGFLENQSRSVRTDQRLRLQQIAEATGGQAYFPLSLKELDAVYAKIVEEVNARYVLGYQSTDGTEDGAWRRVDIKIVRDDLKSERIRTRRGYFAPYREARRP